jgi:hypothetical protein
MTFRYFYNGAYRPAEAGSLRTILHEVGSILVEPALTAATQERGNECRRAPQSPGLSEKGI